MSPFRLPLLYLARVAEDHWALKLAGMVLGAAWAYLASTDAEAKAITALVILVVLDFVTGLAASVRSGKRVESKRIADTGYKGLGYMSVIIAAAAIENIAPGAPDGVVVVAFVVPLALAEIWSLLENARRLGVRGTSKLAKVVEDLLGESRESSDRGPSGRKKP